MKVFHIMCIMKTSDKELVLYDAQTGKNYTGESLVTKLGEYKSADLLRVDDKYINPYYRDLIGRTKN